MSASSVSICLQLIKSIDNLIKLWSGTFEKIRAVEAGILSYYNFFNSKASGKLWIYFYNAAKT